MKDKLNEIAAQYLSVHLAGVAEDEEIIFDKFRFDVAVDIVKVSMFARKGPSGAAFTIDFLKDGAEQTKTASISAGQQSGNAAIAGLSYTALQDFGIKVKNVGSTFPGAEIDIKIHCNVQPIP
ncbi:hypothetical protein [Nitrospina gracilis]|uniref:hypothetical protein n=1 Tax=Nitrospina gracilis TaxID=35801 RepID=UPI001F39444B|nr:hypothetical protein [Nitrospina gracilis]MCF8719203.1 hypothetical protein [Nitrospina gracilis Nb-211]